MLLSWPWFSVQLVDLVLILVKMRQKMMFWFEIQDV